MHDYDAVFSDKHCRISWTISRPNIGQNSTINVKPSMINIKKSHRNMWSNVKALDFSNNININDLNDIRENLGNPDAHIDCILNKIQKLYKGAADITLGPEYEFKVDVNKKYKPIRFDRETLNKRNRYYKAKRANNGSDEMKNELKIASKDYKKAVKKAKAINKKQKINKLRNSKTNNPKCYWSVLNSKNNNKINNSSNRPTLDNFFEEFKNLSGTVCHGEFSNDLDENVVNMFETNEVRELADQILNVEFTEEEIFSCVKDLKNGKACGTDKILNEFIKSTFSKMKQVYVDLFNRILNDGQIPESWTIGMIIPIYKNKGDKGDFNNYRGITILSCLGKMFTSVINSRLNKYANETRLINENQTGFRKNYSTLDHIFLLKNFIDIFVKNSNQKLYCAFVDYKKAFDTVCRSGLWYKLINSGITGKLYNVIVNMYKNIKSCVNSDGNLSDFFISVNGMRQGVNMSPFLFALFVNDIEQFLVQYGCSPIEITGANMEIYFKLLIIMYADDTVLFASS